MNTSNKIKLEKYIPVRKQLKAISKTNVCQKQPINGGLIGCKTALPEAA